MLMYSSTETSSLSGGVLGGFTIDRAVAGRRDRLRLVRDDLADVRIACSDLALDGIRRFNVGTFCMLSQVELGKF